VLGRIEQHALQIEPMGCLDLSLLADRDPRASQSLGQLVANPFELAEVEESGIGATRPGAGV
jgi:hypothetical protein